MSLRQHRRAAAAGLAAAALAAGAFSAPSTATAAESALSDSPLVLKAPATKTVRSHDGWVYSDFGLQLAAQHEDFEIRANRVGGTPAPGQWWDPAYDSPITAVWKTAAGDVPLPEGSMTSWQGLDGFAQVVIRKEGRRRAVHKRQSAGCFNSWSAKPVVPDHASRNAYPFMCPWNPFTLGSVMGVSKGFAVPAIGEFGYYSARLAPGSYTLKMQIAPEWREFFGISDADGVVTQALTVRKARSRNNFRAPQRPSGAPTGGPNLQLEENGQAPAADSAGALANEFAPDLRSLPAFGATMNRKGNAVRFGATVWNGGHGPMVIEGFEPQEPAPSPAARHDGERHLDAYQYYFDGDGNITGHDRVGEFSFHEGNHNHWHFQDFARYRLLHDVDGMPGDVAVRSTKVSFCLANTDAVDYTVPNAEWRPENTDLSGSSCGGRSATYLRQVLSNGSGDTYYQYRTGQAFRVGNLPDGDYWISVEANPADDATAPDEGRNLRELDYTNNDSVRKITLTTNRRGVRRVVMAPVGTVDESFGGFRQQLRALR